MPRVSVQTRFDCKHTVEVQVRLDDDVGVPDEVRGLGKCADCMKEGRLIPISGVQPQSDGKLVVDSIFMMPIE